MIVRSGTEKSDKVIKMCCCCWDGKLTRLNLELILDASDASFTSNPKKQSDLKSKAEPVFLIGPSRRRRLLDKNSGMI